MIRVRHTIRVRGRVSVFGFGLDSGSDVGRGLGSWFRIRDRARVRVRVSVRASVSSTLDEQNATTILARSLAPNVIPTLLCT